MRKTILTVIAVSLMTASTVQIAAAGERHHAAKTVRAVANEQFRNSNASVAPGTTTVQPDWSRYNGGMSAPAGR